MELDRIILLSRDLSVALDDADDMFTGPLVRSDALGQVAKLQAEVFAGTTGWGRYQPPNVLELRYAAHPTELWRITKRDLQRAGGDGSQSASLTCRPFPVRHLSGHVARRILPGADVDPTVALIGVSPSEALSRALSTVYGAPEDPVSYHVGDVSASLDTEITLSATGKSVYQVLEQIADAAGGALQFEWTGSGFLVHLRERIGTTDPLRKEITERPLRRGAPPLDLKTTQSTTSFFSAVMPLGQQGLTIAGAEWRCESASYDAASDETAVIFEDRPVWMSGALIGEKLVDASAESPAVHEVLESTSPSTVVVRGDASGLARARFVRAQDEPLTSLRDPEAEQDWVIREKPVQYNAVAPFANLLEEAGVSADGSALSGWFDLDGTATIETAAPEWLTYGQSVVKVSADRRRGVQTAAIDWSQEKMGPYVSAHAMLRVESGRIGMALVDSEGSLYPPLGSKAEIDGGEKVLRGYQITGAEPVDGDLRLVIWAREDGTVFYIDAAAVAAKGTAVRYRPLMGPRALWQKAANELRRNGGIPTPQVSGSVVNLSKFAVSGPEIGVGDAVTLYLRAYGDDVPQPAEARVRSVREELSVGDEAMSKRLELGPRPVNRFSVAGPGSPEDPGDIQVGDGEDSGDEYENEPMNKPPKAGFVITTDGLTVSIQDRSSDPEGRMNTVSYFMGDGTALAADNLTHTYPEAGTYQITQRVEDIPGVVRQLTKTVTVGTSEPNAPIADFQIDTRSGLDLSITDTSTDPDGDLSGIDVDWGDGQTSAGAPGDTLSHTYGAEGTYSVTLTATDAGGRTGEKTIDIAIGSANGAPPDAGFTVQITNVVLVSVSSTSTDPDDDITTYRWEFGDGTSGTGPTAEHQYEQTDQDETYTIVHEVVDANGNVDTAEQEISIPGSTDPIVPFL